MKAEQQKCSDCHNKAAVAPMKTKNPFHDAAAKNRHVHFLSHQGRRGRQEDAEGVHGLPQEITFSRHTSVTSPGSPRTMAHRAMLFFRRVARETLPEGH
jgi:hypothetical protein